MTLTTGLTIAGALGCGLVAGIFYAFSTFIMRALAQRPKPEGIAAMQAINVTVLNPWFFLAFFGTGAVCIALVIVGLTGVPADRLQLISGALLYLGGCIGVTIAGNVPLNNRLAAVDPHTAEAEALWDHYLARWTFWNHVGTAGSFIAAGVFALQLVN